MKTSHIFFSLLLSTFILQISYSQVSQTPANIRMQGYEKRAALQKDAIAKNLEFTNVGPTIFSGRIVDFDVNPEDPTHFYAAYASGGLWYTTNNGNTLSPVFDQEAVMTIGDIHVDWKKNTIWVGSGENNSSRSSYSGVGMYKSTDAGKTWQHKGLTESHHISRIIVHPNDPNTIWVAVLGHLYSPNAERGIYKTKNGGNSWEKVLYVDQNTGGVDLVADPQDPTILYAAMWHRERRAWDFVESGGGSGIYKSTDGGSNWSRISTSASGFPQGQLIGRIGLDIYNEGGNSVIYALLDNYNRRPPEDDKEKTDDVLTKEDLREMSKEQFLDLDSDQIEEYLTSNGFPRKYNEKKVSQMIKNDQIKPVALVEFLENANSLLFDTPVIAAEVYSSKDGGTSWKKMNKDYIDFLYNSYGYYFGQVRVSPQNPEKIYVLGVPMLRSDDGGQTYKPINGNNVHSDHHALWVNPNREGHLINGNDGGINISYDDGEEWFKMNSPAVGQFYSVAVDLAKPYNIYGGLQDNGVWMGPNNYEASTRWQSSGSYPYKSIMGGDGMQVAIDTRDNETVYTGFQFGNYSRVNTTTGARKRVTPMHELGDRPYRWNWETPIHLSTHNQDILYMGSNKLHRSFNQGDDFEEISGDLTQGGIKGDVPYGTLASIYESSLKFGLIYTGSDDGLIHVTRDGGSTWKNITGNLPRDLWVASIQTSSHEVGRVYASLNGYRWDDFNSYCYRSDDYGNTWNRIGRDLPVEPVNVLKEDPVNPDLLYIGTDHGAYYSLDGGKKFQGFTNGLPAVPVHDLVVHPTENDLILATHGRSFYKTSVKELQKLDAGTLAKELVVFEMPDSGMRPSSRWGSRFANWGEYNEPEVQIPVYAKSAGKASIKVYQDDLMVSEWSVDLTKGLNFLPYHVTMAADKVAALTEKVNEKVKKEKDKVKIKKADDGNYYLPLGKYVIKITHSGVTDETTFELKAGR